LASAPFVDAVEIRLRSPAFEALPLGRGGVAGGDQGRGRGAWCGTIGAVAETITVVGLDHVVFNVADEERSLAFYCGELGLDPVRVDDWRRGEAPFPSVRLDPATIIDLLRTARTGENVNHICVVVEPVDFDAVKASDRFVVVDGPARRYGARGEGTSLYVRDPDENIVELRYY
jgi:catechol 2,3-dioxygenase-like lactoylglutathione lyase family enzyme